MSLTEQQLLFQLAAAEARDSLERFITFMHDDPAAPDDPDLTTYSVKPHHRYIIEKCELIEKSVSQRYLVSLPPRAGKSQITTRYFPAWFLGRHPELSVIIGTYNDELAKDFGRDLKAIFEHPRFAKVFPKFKIARGSKSVAQIRTTRGGRIYFVGRGTAVTGRGADLLIGDDFFKDMKESRSKTIRDQVWLWFSGVLMNRLMSDKANVILVGTRWDEDDHFGRLTDRKNPFYDRKTAKKWHDVNIPAIAGHNDPMGRKPGDVLWPERFSKDFLAEQRALNPVAFSALYQGKPTPESGIIFQPSYFPTYKRHQLPSQLRIYVASDHAVSGDVTADSTAMVVCGVDCDSTIWIIDAVWGRFTTDKAVERMIDLMEQWKPMVWWAEKGQISKAIGPFLRKRMMERGVFCAMQEVPAVGNKASRAQSICGRMAMGKVIWPDEKPWFVDARAQFMQFTGEPGKRDDFVDAVSYLGVGLHFLLPAGQQRVEKKEPDRYTGAWLKAESKRQARESRRFSMMGGYRY